MTDTAPPRTQYDLVPGITAYRLNSILSRVMIAVYVVAGGIVLWYVFGVATAGAHANRLVMAVVVVAPSLVWTIVSAMLVRRRDTAELAAGYTTRTGVLHQFDQVDPVTGVVIRRAGSAVLTKPERRARESGAGLSAGAILNGASSSGPRFEGPASRAQRWLLVLAMVVVVALVFVIPVVATVSHGEDAGFAIGVVLLVLGASAVIMAVIYTGIALRTRQRLGAVARRRPDAFVFLSRRTTELEDTLDELKGTDGKLGPSITVSVGPAGVELWRGSTDEPRVAFAWSTIGHVHPGRLLAAINNRQVAARTIHVFLGDGARLDAPLPVYGRHGITVSGADHANEVLDAFRRFTTVA